MNNHIPPFVLLMLTLLLTSIVTSENQEIDSDGDTLSDEQELFYNLNPNNPDMDADGLLDGEELRLGTNPLEQDTDKDGLSDQEEYATYTTDPLLSDTDEDGFKDGEEIKANTNPRDKNSAPGIAAPATETLEVNKQELNILRAELIGNEVPIQEEEKREEKKYTAEELERIQADYDAQKNELHIDIKDQARVAASQERYFIDFDVPTHK